MTFRIVHISDTHLSAERPYFNANFACIGRAIAAERADVVINSGDISLDGASTASDLVEARRLHDALHLPVRYIPGNHDVGDNLDVESDQGQTINAARHEDYRRVFGEDWWQLDVPGWRILAVDAQLFGSDLDAAQEQAAFVAAAASGAGTRQLALFIHKPLCDAHEDESEVGGRFLNPVPRRQLLEALGPTRPSLVASGHVHQYRSRMIDGAHHVWAPSTAFVIPDARQPRYGVKRIGYVVYELFADGRHESRFAAAEGTIDNDISDFPPMYGPMD